MAAELKGRKPTELSIYSKWKETAKVVGYKIVPGLSPPTAAQDLMDAMGIFKRESGTPPL